MITSSAKPIILSCNRCIVLSAQITQFWLSWALLECKMYSVPIGSQTMGTMAHAQRAPQGGFSIFSFVSYRELGFCPVYYKQLEQWVIVNSRNNSPCSQGSFTKLLSSLRNIEESFTSSREKLENTRQINPWVLVRSHAITYMCILKPGPH